MSAEPDIAIRVRGLVTRFGDQVVHDELDLDVRRGEILGVVGPSGCGKSVLLREIVGLDPPTAGEIEVFGRPLMSLDKAERRGVEERWGVMFQDGALFSSLTVRENVEAPFREHTHLPLQLVHVLSALPFFAPLPSHSSHCPTLEIRTRLSVPNTASLKVSSMSIEISRPRAVLARLPPPPNISPKISPRSNSCPLNENPPCPPN